MGEFHVRETNKCTRLAEWCLFFSLSFLLRSGALADFLPDEGLCEGVRVQRKEENMQRQH